MNKLIFLSLFLILFAGDGLAQTVLFEEKRPVGTHKKQRSEHTFKVERKLSPDANIPFANEIKSIPVPALVFSGELPPGAGAYDALPQCRQNRVRNLFRDANESSFLSLDVIVYDYENSRDRERAKRSKIPAVPYIMGALYNPHRPVGDQGQSIVRSIGLECLPARVISITKQGQKAFEYREGETAWTDTPEQ